MYSPVQYRYGNTDSDLKVDDVRDVSKDVRSTAADIDDWADVVVDMVRAVSVVRCIPTVLRRHSCFWPYWSPCFSSWSSWRTAPSRSLVSTSAASGGSAVELCPWEYCRCVACLVERMALPISICLVPPDLRSVDHRCLRSHHQRWAFGLLCRQGGWPRCGRLADALVWSVS